MSHKNQERLSEKIVGPKSEAELLKKIAEHEVFSTAYKLKLAAIIGKKAAILAGKGAVVAGKGVAAAGKQAAKGVKKVVQAAKAEAEQKRRDW